MQQEHVTRLTPDQIARAHAADPVDLLTRRRQQNEGQDIVASMPLIAYIRSGGQTGADRGGLDAARDMGTPICGWCPPGGLAEDLPEPPGVLALYPELKEGQASGYVERTAWNVRDSHATLIVSPGGLEPLSGTEMTAVFAKAFGRPILVLDDIDGNVQAAAQKALAWLQELGLRGITLNVAGPRESKVPGVYNLSRDVVTTLLSMAH